MGIGDLFSKLSSGRPGAGGSAPDGSAGGPLAKANPAHSGLPKGGNQPDGSYQPHGGSPSGQPSGSGIPKGGNQPDGSYHPGGNPPSGQPSGSGMPKGGNQPDGSWRPGGGQSTGGGGATDPTSHFAKIETPGTDPTSQLMKYSTPGTDAPSFGQLDPGPIQHTFGQLDPGPVQMPGSQVMLNPQPLPPGGNAGISGNLSWSGMGDGSVRPQGPSSFGEGGAQTESAGGGAAGRGLLGAIIVVCLIGLLFGGGLVLVPKFFLSPGALLNPGVIAWEGQGNAQASTLAHSGQAQTAQSGPDVKTSCRKTGSSSLQEHLIGGGFDFQPGSDPSVAAPDNSASQWDWRLHLTSGKATSYAICLREPPAFFSPANALDYVAGPVAAPSFDDPFTAIASEASCSSGGSSSLLPINSSSTIAPSAGHIVGGGYVLGGSTPPRVNSSYPIVDGSGARWHVSADAFGLPSSSNLQAFAICSGTVTTHLEHTALKMFVGDPLTFFGDGAASCTSGTLLSGGYHVTDGQDDIGLGVDIQTNAPGKSLKVNATTGDTFTDWTVTLNGTSKGAKAKSVIGDVWVVCWDPTAQPQPTQTTQTTQATPTTQAVPTATPVGVAQPTPTPTPRPQPTPTNTPAPQCQVFMQGSASNVNVDLSDINLDGSGPATQPNASSHIRYSQLPASGAIFSPVNSSTLHDVAIGADYGALDCARLRGFSYGGGTAPYTVGEVFAVKTPGGHYAKVLIAAGVGGPLQVQWVTYTIS